MKHIEEEIRFHHSYTVNIIEYNSMPDETKDIINRECAMVLANYILKEKPIEIIKYDNYVDFRIDLFVASPKKFNDIVNELSEKIALRFK